MTRKLNALNEQARTSSVRRWSIGSLSYDRGQLWWLAAFLFMGAFAIAIRDRAIGPSVTLLLKRAGTSNAVVALLLSSFPLVLGILLGPVIGTWSDRLRSRWGRRMPFVAVPAPFAVVSLVGIAVCEPVGAWAAGVVGAAAATGQVAFFVVCWVVFQVAVVVSTPVFVGLVNDVTPREVLGRFAGLKRAASLIAAIAFNYLLLGRAEKHFTETLLLVAALFVGAYTLLCVGVKEESGEAMPAATGGVARRGLWAEVTTYVRECFGQPYYLLVFAVGTLGALTFVPISLFNILYAKQLGVDLTDVGAVLAGSAFVSLCLAYPLGAVADRFHPLPVGTVAMALYVAAMSWATVYIHDGRSLLIALAVQTVACGTYLTSTAALTQALLPREKFLQLGSAANVVTAVATAVVGPAMGAVLDRTGQRYELIYLATAVFSGATLVLLLLLLRGFVRRGGRRGYVAP